MISKKPTQACQECGASISTRAEICPKCGVRQHTGKVRDRIIATVLAVLFGGLGAHKFYLGKIVWGLIYLFFSWTFIPTILGILEGICYLSMSDDVFGQRYGVIPSMHRGKVTEETPSHEAKPKSIMQKEISAPAAIAIALIFISVITLIIMTVGEPAESNISQKRTSATADEAFVMSQHFVEASLKSPATADFPWFDYSYRDLGDSTYEITSYVDAQNSFGAVVRTPFVVTLHYEGGSVTDESSWDLLGLQLE